MVEKKTETNVEIETDSGEEDNNNTGDRGESEDSTDSKKTNDPVQNPDHYTMARAECIEIIQDLGLGYHVATAMKYLWRCNFKGNKKQDLEKAKWFIERELEYLENDN